MAEKQKILLCGDVEGRFETLFKRVEHINKKSGPFDCLLCVGNFFGVNNKELIPYKIGEKKVPIATYILGPNKEEDILEYPINNSHFEICSNVYYLGKRGLYVDSKGIKIAYISGVSNLNSKGYWTCSEKDVSDLCDVCIKGNPSFRGVDILLTSQWPSNIICDTTKNLKLSVNSCSDLPSYLCMKLKPRYVVGGLEGVFYERPPFRCPNLGDHDTTIEVATRFIGLARVGNPNKDKWIYALSLTPLDKTKFTELLQKTTDETTCPFNAFELESKIFKKSKKNSNPNQYFYDMDAPLEDKKNRKSKRPKIDFDESKCWFCLASPSVEKHLIICVGNKTYMALAKGAMVEEHFLICPIEHHQSILTLQKDVIDEINLFKESITKFYNRDGKLAVFFERNYKTSHMQLQAIPIPRSANRELQEIFIEESDAQGFKLEILESHNRLDQVLPPKVPYFTVELPGGILLYTKLQGATSFPVNFAREVLASGPVLNMNEREDWKNCILVKEDEEKIVKRLRTDFEPYDFTSS